MPISLHNFAVNVAGAAAGGTSKLHSYGAQVGHLDRGTVSMHSYGLQVLYPHVPLLNFYSLGAVISFRADQHPNGGYANPATFSDAEEEDVIYTDVIFPECISYGSTGVPRYLTDKAEVLSGDEQRQTRWKYPRHEYSINMENLPAAEIAEVMNIWHIVSGDFAGFLFLDPLDHTSGNTSTNFSPSVVTMTDQEVAVANAALTEYPLYKYYTHNNRQKQRRILHPKLDTLRIAVDGFETFQWEYDSTQGVLRFLKRIADGTAITATKAAGILSSTGAPFANFEIGDLIFVDGFVNDSVNQTTGGPHRVRLKIDDDTLELERFNGNDWFAGGTGDEVDAAITITSALPPTGELITAGFYFYVPVRFDDGDNAMSEIVAGMRESAYATFGDIKLKEIFE